MRLLAIETSGGACSAALLIDGAVYQRLEPAPRRHAELLLPMMDALLADAGLALRALDAIAFGQGPGSFTGVRIACAVAQGAAFGTGLPVVPVSTLAALAQGGHRASGAPRLLPALDARMGEVYWGAYAVDEQGLVRPCLDDLVIEPPAVPLPDPGTGLAGWTGLGSGWQAHGAALRARVGARLHAVLDSTECEARDVAVLAAAALHRGEACAPQDALPLYLRDRVATPKLGG